jgi:hypothetical protein
MKKIHLFGALVSMLVVFALVLASLPTVAQAMSHPIACYGDVTLNGDAAPVGSVIDIYLGDDVTPSGTATLGTAGQYLAQIWADESRHGELLTYRVNGFPATKLGPDMSVFGWGNQEVDLEAFGEPTPTAVYPDPTVPSHTWQFYAAGFYGQHLPDAYDGEVILADLDTADIPDEVQLILYYDPALLDWVFWVPGVGGDLISLTGQFYQYYVSVSGACTWVIPLP